MAGAELLARRQYLEGRNTSLTARKRERSDASETTSRSAGSPGRTLVGLRGMDTSNWEREREREREREGRAPFIAWLPCERWPWQRTRMTSTHLGSRASCETG